jgi:hypothetical protein
MVVTVMLVKKQSKKMDSLIRQKLCMSSKRRLLFASQHNVHPRPLGSSTTVLLASKMSSRELYVLQEKTFLISIGVSKL